jgi:hypothetical protein
VATVTITFEDAPDGDIKIKMESDPPFLGPAAYKKARKTGKPPKVTKAQAIGMAMMREMCKEADSAYKAAE